MGWLIHPAGEEERRSSRRERRQQMMNLLLYLNYTLVTLTTTGIEATMHSTDSSTCRPPPAMLTRL
jgi:hypothetical protein